MALIVQKFGGTSVANTEKILSAARRAIREVKNGNQVVMVVSAMGKSTDHLIELAREISDRPNSREMDMLLSTGEQVTVALMAIALESLGHKAISFTAAQIGIKTDNSFNKARIRSISTERMRDALKEGKIVIAAGFQGIDDDFNITTLGRGGSDTTAVALAAALRADVCDIFTDVDGVYTTDPRIVPEARRVSCISYDEMLELASMGAGVMHSRSIEFAKKFGVPVHVRSSFSDNPGTVIGPDPESRDVPVCGAALAKNEARITVVEVPDEPGVAMNLFSRIAEAKIPTDMIAQNASTKGRTDISFTVPGEDFVVAQDIVKKVAGELGASGVEYNENVSKVSIVGLGMVHQTGVARKMFHALSEHGINIEMITTSDIKISALVERNDAIQALRAVHEAFELDRDPASRTNIYNSPNQKSAKAEDNSEEEDKEQVSAELVSRLAGMEEILIEKVDLDQSQARFTFANVPDEPGLAAAVFDKIAQANIVVDMIVQSVGRNNLANISFTVPRDELDAVNKLAKDVASTWKCDILQNPMVAKLSVRGTGLRSHTGLASRMFRTLSSNSINVSIICTSERCVSVIVNDEAGEKSFSLSVSEFAEEML
ncbi:MAG: aspartate kinase [Planctomycetia bacterium]|nr:aspartate kinase [Planctomycetia bacterium]